MWHRSRTGRWQVKEIWSSLLTGGDNASFASLLDLGGNKSGLAHRATGSRGKQGSRLEREGQQRGAIVSRREWKCGGHNGPVGLQTLPNVGIAPWRLNSVTFRQVEPQETSLTRRFKATNDGPGPHASSGSQGANGRGAYVEPPAGLDENVAEMTPFDDLKDPGLIEPSKGSIARKSGYGDDPVATPNDKGMVSTIVQLAVWCLRRCSVVRRANRQWCSCAQHAR